MKGPVENLVVVGGGTAGWMAAALLKARFASRLNVTVIDSDRISTVGVGEATLPVMRDLLRSLRIDEDEMLRHCDASFKAGLRFQGWRTGGPEDVYYHLFFGADGLEPFLQLIDRLHATEGTADLWRRLIGRGTLDGRAFMKDLTLAGALVRNRKASRRWPDPPFESPLGYAYHIDARRFADFLREWSIRRGVRHLKDHIESVEIAPDGNLTAVVTAGHGPIHGDFFVDCSGFRGLLINEALKEPFEPYGRWLLCDRAVAIQLPYGEETEEIPAHTRLDALSAGWAWRIPLYSRQGSGYVYSESFVSSEEAERELRSRLGPGAEESAPNHLRMRVGKNQRTWVQNCLSVGLAAGFLEALESTSIAFIQRGVARFLRQFRDRCYDGAGRDQYNHEMTVDFEECRDFLVLHYCLTEREDTPFWRECRRRERPDRIGALLEEWTRRGSLRRFIEGEGVGRFFPAVSWYSILLGMEAPPGEPRSGGEDQIAPELAWLGAERSRLAELAAGFPDHRSYLASLRSAAAE